MAVRAMLLVSLLSAVTVSSLQNKDEVTNLTLTPATDSICASWEMLNPSGNVLYYTVNWINGLNNPLNCNIDSDITNTENCPIGSPLAPCTKYNVTVQPLNEDSINTGVPASAEDYTLPSATAPITPSCAPSGSTIANLHFNISWTSPGECVLFTVSWEGDVLWQDDEEPIRGTVTTREGSVALDDPRPYTRYNVNVTWPGGSALCEGTTAQTAPSAPAIQSVVSASSRSLTASWYAPEEINGVLGDYTVSCTADGAQTGSETTAGTSLIIDGLDACVTYSVTVMAKTEGGQTTSNAKEGTTRDEAPPAVKNLANSSEARSITLTWTRPVTACNVTDYFISYNGTAMWGTPEGHSDNVTSENTSFVVTGLVPYSSYNMCVLGRNSKGDGAETCLEAVETDEAAPGAPASVTTKPSNSTVTVSWQAPEELNGVLRNYTLSWGDTSSHGGSEVLSPDTLSFEVVGLESCHEYRFTVAGVTGGGTGGNGTATGSPTTEVSEPNPVSCSLSGPLVTVYWTAPETECDIVNNTVSWEGDVLWSDGQDNDECTAGATDSSFTLPRTVPYTRYTVSVATKVAGGGTSAEGTCQDQLVTPEEAPSAPQNLNLSDATSTSLTVTWEAPEVLNGWLRNYTVTWGLGSDTTTREIDNATLNCKIEGLEGGTRYKISVKAVTISESEPATASFDTQPSTVVDGGENVGAIIGAVVGVLFVVALLAVAYIKRDWLRANVNSSDNNKGSDKYDKQLGHYSKLERELAVKIESLVSRPGSLTREFAAMDARSYKGSTVIGTLPVNAGKNRYINILPFDESRVALIDNMTDGHDYINASFVPSVTDRSHVFVATQTPKENTVQDFWRMVWNLNVKTIVMLSDKIDEHKARSDQYWPQGFDNDLSVLQFEIKLMKERVTAAFMERRLVVTRGGNSREVSQFHFSEWTAHDVSNSTKELLEFLCEVRKNVEPEQKRVVVHCLAGVGRTGTLIALWNLQRLAETLPQDIDVEDTILQLRHHRMQLVQTKEQYFHLLETLLEYLKNPAFWLPVKDKETYMRPREVGAGQKHHRPQQSTNLGVSDKPMYMSPPVQFRNSSRQQDGSHTNDQAFVQDNYLDSI